MPKILTFILVIFLSFSAQGQKRTTLVDSLRQNISLLNETIRQSNETIKVLDERLSQANDTINNQGTMVSSFEVIYSILTIIFTIIGLLIPIVTYYFSIKPSRELIKEIESKIDRRLEEYLKKTRQENIDSAIDNLISNSAELKQNSIAYLSLTQHEGLTDVQYFKLYKVLNSSGIDATQKYTLGYILTGKENDFATEYCISILKSRSPYSELITARYFGMIGVTKYISNFVEYLRYVPEKPDAFMRIISHMKIVSLDSVIELFNSDEIISLFTKENLVYFKNYRLTNSFERGLEEDKIKATKLFKLVFGE